MSKINPFITAVADYHELDEVVRHFTNAGIDLEFKEVGCFKSDLWSYHAVFFEKGMSDEAAELIARWKN